jgi:hypothetical protein
MPSSSSSRNQRSDRRAVAALAPSTRRKARRGGCREAHQDLWQRPARRDHCGIDEGRVSANYTRIIDRVRRVFLHVEFTTERRDVTDYAIVLLIQIDGHMETVRVYDGAHGVNELHRYGRQSGKEAAEIFHRGTLGEGMRAAIEEAESGYEAMIESWSEQ